MKKIAYLVPDHPQMFYRVAPYIKNNPGYEHNVVVPDRTTVPSTRPKNCSIISYAEFDNTEFDLIIPSRDKLFPIILQRYGIHRNVNDKEVMHRCLSEFGYPTLLQTGFTDESIVIVKPKVGTSSISNSPIGYTPQKYSDIKQFITDDDIVQEYIAGNHTMVSFPVIVGRNGQIYSEDIAFYEFVQLTEGGTPSLVAVETDRLSKYPQFRNDANKFVDFIRFIQYDKIPGSYFMQCFVIDGALYPIDFNARLGLTTFNLSMNNILEHHFLKMIPFMVGDMTLEACIATTDICYNKLYWHYESNGVRLSTGNLPHGTRHKIPLGPVTDYAKDFDFYFTIGNL